MKKNDDIKTITANWATTNQTIHTTKELPMKSHKIRDNPDKKNWKGPTTAKESEKQILFFDLCDFNSQKKYIIGFSHFGRVMFDLWNFIQGCHNQDLRIGNLRPWDLSLKIVNDTKPTMYRFSLVNPDSTAKVNEHGKLIKKYSDLDMNFVHPEYTNLLHFNDQARLDQDWYAFSVLCCWFITKFDPFGAGIVITKPGADRIYRMKNILLSQSSEIDITERERLFIRRAVGRLSLKVRSFVQAFISRRNLHQTPSFLLDEFHNENMLTCKAEIFKRGRDGNPQKVNCGFKQMASIKKCGYCDASHVKMITTSHQMFQTAEQSATD